MRVSEHSTLSLATNKVLFHLILVSRRRPIFRQLSFVSSLPASVDSAQVSNGKQCRHEIDVSSIFATFQFHPRGLVIL